MICHTSIHQDGSTALIRAAWNGDVASVTLLLDKGARIDIADKVEAMPTSKLLC